MVDDVVAPGLGDLGVIDLSTQACWGEPLFDAATAIAFLPLADGAARGDLPASLASIAPGGERESVQRRLGPYAVWFALYYRFATNHPRLYDWTQVVLERAAQLLEGAEADRILCDA
jgi:hypothetical protein